MSKKNMTMVNDDLWILVIKLFINAEKIERACKEKSKIWESDTSTLTDIKKIHRKLDKLNDESINLREKIDQMYIENK